jgi:hypothetical protein
MGDLLLESWFFQIPRKTGNWIMFGEPQNPLPTPSTAKVDTMLIVATKIFHKSYVFPNYP